MMMNSLLLKIFGPIFLLVSLFALGDCSGYHRAEKKYLVKIEQIKFEVKDTAQKLQIKDEQHARKTEQSSVSISKDKSGEYQMAVAELRNRYERLLAEARANSSGGGESNLPGVPNTTSGPDDSTLQDRLLCSIQSTQLKSLQDWIVDQKDLYDRANKER